MATQYADIRQGAERSTKRSADRPYLIGPVADFLCFGGSALIILPLLLLLPAGEFRPELAAWMMLAANFINHPHFAHSYQIFYRGFSDKLFGRSLGRAIRLRYLFAGVVAPALLVGFIALCLLQGNARLLGLAGNLMALTVGWHYVKQGYGLLMVDCALKRRFFAAGDKKLLLINCYAVWIASWTQFNAVVSREELGGIQYFTFAIPAPLVTLTLAAALGTTAATVWMLVKRRRAAGALPVNGLIAYAVSLYPWLLFIQINPLWGLVVPALHSIQYLAVTWRFQLNYERARLADPRYRARSIARQAFGSNPFGHLALFVVIGAALGFCGFWLFPGLLNAFVPYDQALFGGTMFVFAAWVFINVHHYFIDNVIWRRDNPETKLYLFG